MAILALARARDSILGLAVGDAFGEALSVPDAERRAALRLVSRHLPWRWTDDTAMALSIVEILEQYETINPDALSAAFVRRWAAEPDRGYGAGAVELFTRIRGGSAWDTGARALFRARRSRHDRRCRRRHRRPRDRRRPDPDPLARSDRAASDTMTDDRISGLLLGTAVGDSLGLPREGLSARRAARLFRGPLRQRFLFGRGMMSDDTEHACMTAQALLASRDDPRRFARTLAWKLRWWLLAMPAGIGWGTLRALVRLWVGFSPERSGVHSAGNGAAMRAPIIGAWCDDLDRVAVFVNASTRITHRDSRAVDGALAVAIAAHHATRAPSIDASHVLRDIRARTHDHQLLAALDRVEDALRRDLAPAQLAAELGLHRGVTGYMLHTVPMCLHAWLRSPYDARRAISDVVELGGDADTTGAIVGALAGATVGSARLPPEWLVIADWPRSPSWIRRLAASVVQRGSAPRLFWPAIPLRNALFAAIAMVTGLRRALPPY